VGAATQPDGRAALDSDPAHRLSPYVPRLVVDWLRRDPAATVQEVDGTLAFLDISGFTKLTERLAKHGREGAEEMSDILNSTFAALLTVGYQDGAGLVKWGGDAVLLLFDGEGHQERAARATLRMRATMRDVGRLSTSAGSVVLRMSAGLNSGRFHFFLVGDPSLHRELLIAGPEASLTADLESAANAGQVAVSTTTAAALPRRCLGGPVGEGFLLRAEPDIETVGITPARNVTGLDIAGMLPGAIRDHLLQQPGEAEHRTIGVGFVQFSGTDQLLRDEGPAALAEALHEVIVSVQQATHHYGVTFFETDINADGGKVMLTAGAPVSRGHDEDRLLNAARQIVESPSRLSVRVGLNRGPVFSGDFGPPFRRTYSVKGDAVNVAARVMGKAVPGQVLATRAVTERRRTSFVLTELPPLVVKGKSRPIEASAVGPVTTVVTQAHDTLPLLSRGSELTVLGQCVARAGDGTGSVTLVAGDRGSGRSRLVAELTAALDTTPVVETACDEYDANSPYLAMRRLLVGALTAPSQTEDLASRLATVGAEHADLAPWLPLLGVLLDVDVASTRATDELDEEFRKSRMEWAAVRLLELMLPSPTVVVVDDVHHLDEASFGLLTGVLESATRRRPWAVILTTRTGSEQPWDELATERLTLSALSRDEAAELIAAATEDAPLPPAMIDAIIDRADGNPFFLQSLLAVAKANPTAAELPESLEGLVNVEIDQLSPAHRRVLRYASVLGVAAEPDLLAHMLEDSWIAPSSPEFAPLLRFLDTDADGDLVFRNSIMRDVAYEGLPYRRRRQLHEQAGAALLERSQGSARDEVERLAWHFHLADRPDAAWRYGRQAAERAHDKFAHTEASRFLGWSVRAGRQLKVDPDELAEVLELLGDTEFTIGLSAQARGTYQQAARSARNRVRGARLQLKLGRLDQRVGNLSQSLRRLTRGMQLVASDVSEPALAVQAEIATRYAIGRFQQGRYRDAKAWGERAIDVAGRSADLEVLANAHNAMEAITLWAGLVSDEAHGEVALALYEKLGDLAGQGHSLNNLAIRSIFEGRWNQTQGLLSRAAELFEQIGDVASLAAALYNQADVLVRQGRRSDAVPLLERALRIAKSVDDDETVALVLRDWAKAESRAGDPQRAGELLEESITMLEQLGEPQELLDAKAALAELALLTGDAPKARDISEAALRHADEDVASVLPTLYRVRGFAELVLGQDQDSLRSFAAGVELRSPAARHETAFLTAGLAETQRRLGDPAAAHTWEQAQNTMAELGVEVAPFPEGLLDALRTGVLTSPA
jgi:class 3 adenylate cyclase/tetratricopeptide (TPR) repeat protein